ncbi:hypothetical protein C4D60_Mb02t11110 [Musa balbisiana]|uniref:Uncharacterized protein n=1 Tax=Musa balbisiana TaxID=52838 RepID=A0A4S8IB78_MUSBA|nr:hypothetical protein C4D60_Mb02t11110 [Musa balbisiana]
MYCTLNLIYYAFNKMNLQIIQNERIPITTKKLGESNEKLRIRTMGKKCKVVQSKQHYESDIVLDSESGRRSNQLLKKILPRISAPREPYSVRFMAFVCIFRLRKKKEH